MNIQIIGIFIAIIGGIIVTKLLNLKIEKDSLEDKLDIINKQIAYDNERINKRKRKITSNNRATFTDSIYDHVFEEDFDLEKYDHFGLSEEEIKKIYDDIIQAYKDANEIFDGKEYYTDDRKNIIREKNI